MQTGLPRGVRVATNARAGPTLQGIEYSVGTPMSNLLRPALTGEYVEITSPAGAQARVPGVVLVDPTTGLPYAAGVAPGGPGAGGVIASADLLTAATAPAPVVGTAVAGSGRAPSFAAAVAGTGAVSATVVIEARNATSAVWAPYGTMSMSGTTSAADTLAGPAFLQYRARLTAISGTGAAVTVTKGD